MTKAQEVINETREKAACCYNDEDYHRGSQWEQIGNLVKSLSYGASDDDWLSMLVKIAKLSGWDDERSEYVKSKMHTLQVYQCTTARI